ncbi:MAG: FHA domain-containing protein [Planctomycetota bacterium]|nr:FHA domain-containing protein [Planctomycetota bacterium]
MDVKLVVVEGDTSAEEVPVTLPAVIGRGRNAGVTLRHPLISREHCELFESDGRVHVRDKNSLNGTYVDHNNIDEVVVPTGSLLTVGGFTFRVDYNDPGSVAGTVDGSSEESTISAGDDLAAAFQQMTSGTDSAETDLDLDAIGEEQAPAEPVVADESPAEEQAADLNLGSLMELAGGTEETPVEIGELETTEREVPEAPGETPAEVQAPAVQDVDAEIDLNAMFTEQLAEDTPQAEPLLDLGEIAEPAAAEAEPVLDLGEIAEPAAAEAEPPLDLGAMTEPAAAEAEPVLDLGAMTEPAAAAQDNDVLELVDLDEMPPTNAAPAGQGPVEELELVDPEQQPPPATDGDDDDLKSFLNNFK